MDVKIDWWPQDRQLTCLRACGLSHPFDQGSPGPPRSRVIGYGGAAGGGKSDALLAAAMVFGLTYPGAKMVYFRREYPQLEGPGGAIGRSHELLSSWAKWNGTQRRWTFPNGSILQFAHCKLEEDVYNYQSQQFDAIFMDEVTQFTRFQARYLLTRNRLTVNAPAPLCLMSTNPGGVGHHWFGTEFVASGTPEQAHDVEIEPGRFESRFFIPAKLSDNKILEQRDPGYRATLENQDEVTRRMLLDGDWSVVLGAVFKEFRRDVHVEEPWKLPPETRYFTACDRGFASPTCVLKLAVLPWGDIRVIDEIYEPGLIVSELAERWLEMGPGDYAESDPNVWSKHGHTGESEAEALLRAGVPLKKADNDRLNGKSRIHEWLKVIGTGPDATPRLKIWPDCENLIRTLPIVPYDKTRIEDVDTKSEDHAYDALRYALMSRPEPGKSEGIMAGGFPGKRRTALVDEDEDDDDPYEPLFYHQ